MIRPLLVSDPLIHPISTGRKTETRRTNGLDWVNELPDAWEFVAQEGKTFHFKRKDQPESAAINSRYGLPGDTLWVRENWYVDRGYSALMPRHIPQRPSVRRGYTADGPRPQWAGKVRPSLFMPRWLSRFTLEITAVKVERVQEITEEGAAREGFLPEYLGEFSGFNYPARTWYMNTWKNLNGPDSWDLNPWVWVVSFQLLNVKQ